MSETKKARTKPGTNLRNMTTGGHKITPHGHVSGWVAGSGLTGERFFCGGCTIG